MARPGCSEQAGGAEDRLAESECDQGDQGAAGGEEEELFEREAFAALFVGFEEECMAAHSMGLRRLCVNRCTMMGTAMHARPA